jgi:3-hydroxyisobutyrate dehydrogenase/2-hydroxy-3-oxopropionate reductase
MSVGFIGLGNMGQGMADNLLAKGAEPIVYTRTQSKIEAMIERGADGASSSADLVSKVDVVLACLPSVQTSMDVIVGEIVPALEPGQIVVDHSTVDIVTSRQCAQAVEDKGAMFIDAPISGGPTGAEAGTLAIMCGGSDEAFTKALPYLELMGANVKLMGPNGAGTAMKLINQLLVGVNCAAAAEAFALANRAGVDITAAGELLNVSWGNSVMVGRSYPITAARDFADSAAPVRNLDKDLGIIKDLAENEGLSLELASKSYELFHEMMDKGWDENDIAGVLEVIEARSA